MSLEATCTNLILALEDQPIYPWADPLPEERVTRPFVEVSSDEPEIIPPIIALAELATTKTMYL